MDDAVGSDVDNDAQEYDSGDEAQVKGRKTKAQLRREREIEELRAILATHGGRAFIWRLLAQCGVYRQSFTGNSTTFFNEGKRDIGVWLIGELEACDPKAYAKLILEGIEGDKPNG